VRQGFSPWKSRWKFDHRRFQTVTFASVNLPDLPKQTANAPDASHALSKTVSAFLSKFSTAVAFGGVLRPLATFCFVELSFSPKELSVALKKCPPIAKLDVNSDLAPTVEFFRKDLMLSDTSVRRIVKSTPKMLLFSRERLLEDVAAFLDLGISIEQLGTAVCKFPTLLTIGKDKLHRAVAWLEHDLGLEREHTIRLLCRWPSLFAHNVEENLVAKVEFLRTFYGLDKNQLARVLLKAPSVLGMSYERLEKFGTLLREEGGFDLMQIQSIVGRFPSVLTFSPLSLREKLHLLQTELNMTSQQIVTFPACFSYSMARVRLRTKFIRKVRKPSLRPPTANQVLSFSDKAFAEKVCGRNLAEYEAFVLQTWDEEATGKSIE